MSAELWTRDASGVNRKFRELWAQDGAGVNRKLRELWANDGTGVNRKVFSSGIKASATYYQYAENGVIAGSSGEVCNTVGNDFEAGILCGESFGAAGLQAGCSLTFNASGLNVSSVTFNGLSIHWNVLEGSPALPEELFCISDIFDNNTPLGSAQWGKTSSKGEIALESKTVPLSAQTDISNIRIRLYVALASNRVYSIGPHDTVSYTVLIPASSITLQPSGDSIIFN